LDGDVVLFLFPLGDEDSFRGVDSFVHFEAEEVLDFYSLSEMRVTLPLSMTLTTMGKWA
jgi:hypothetical protein